MGVVSVSVFVDLATLRRLLRLRFFFAFFGASSSALFSSLLFSSRPFPSLPSLLFSNRPCPSLLCSALLFSSLLFSWVSSKSFFECWLVGVTASNKEQQKTPSLKAKRETSYSNLLCSALRCSASLLLAQLLSSLICSSLLVPSLLSLPCSSLLVPALLFSALLFASLLFSCLLFSWVFSKKSFVVACLGNGKQQGTTENTELEGET